MIAGALGLLSGTISLATSPTNFKALHLAIGGLTILFGGLGIATGWGDFAPIPLGSSRSNCVGHWINLGDHTTADQCRGMGWPTHFYRDWHLVARVVRRKSCRRGVHDLRLARATCDGFSGVMAPDSRSIIGANRMALADADFLLWSSRPSAILRSLSTSLCVVSFVLGVALLKRSRRVFC